MCRRSRELWSHVCNNPSQHNHNTEKLKYVKNQLKHLERYKYISISGEHINNKLKKLETGIPSVWTEFKTFRRKISKIIATLLK